MASPTNNNVSSSPASPRSEPTTELILFNTEESITLDNITPTELVLFNTEGSITLDNITPEIGNELLLFAVQNALNEVNDCLEKIANDLPVQASMAQIREMAGDSDEGVHLDDLLPQAAISYLLKRLRDHQDAQGVEEEIDAPNPLDESRETVRASLEHFVETVRELKAIVDEHAARVKRLEEMRERLLRMQEGFMEVKERQLRAREIKEQEVLDRALAWRWGDAAL